MIKDSLLEVLATRASVELDHSVQCIYSLLRQGSRSCRSRRSSFL